MTDTPAQERQRALAYIDMLADELRPAAEKPKMMDIAVGWNETAKERLKCIETIRAALTAQGSVPAGYKLVPIEETKEMHISGHDAQCIAEAEHPEHGTVISAIYAAMLSAAPTPPEQQAGVEPLSSFLSAMSVCCHVFDHKCTDPVEKAAWETIKRALTRPDSSQLGQRKDDVGENNG